MQRKRWISIGLMGCVHMHQGIFVIEEWGSPNCVQNVMEKTGENNQKARKTS